MTTIRKLFPPLRHIVVWPKRDVSTCQLLRGVLLVGIIGVTSCLVSSCGNDEQGSEFENAPLVDQIVEFNSGISYEWPLYKSVRETTPHTKFVVDGIDVGPVSDLFVVGTISSVTAGNGYSWPGGPQVLGEPPNRVVHQFNSTDSWVSSIHLSVLVENSLYLNKDFDGLREVTIGLFLLNPIDLSALESELENRRIAASLHSNDKTAFDHEPDVFGVLRGGELLGFVDDTNNVTFPAFHLSQFASSESKSIPLEDLLNPPSVVTLNN